MKKIYLNSRSQGLFAMVDDEDYERIRAHNWFYMKRKSSRHSSYAYRTEDTGGRKNRKRRHIYMHNEITGVAGIKMVDHIDCDGLNNQKLNLRICLWSENLRNRKIRSDSSNQYKGVQYIPSGKRRWQAQIKVGGKRYKSRCFFTEEEAAIAYNDLAVNHHGEFARLNVITSNVATPNI